MPSITIRDLPDSVLEKVRLLSKRHRRSMNSEFLMLIERGLDEETSKSTLRQRSASAALQSEMWELLAGEWEDERSAEQIAEDIYEHRTGGRPVSL